MIMYKCDKCETYFEQLIEGPVTYIAEKGLISDDEPNEDAGTTISLVGNLPMYIYVHKQLCNKCTGDLLIWLKAIPT